MLDMSFARFCTALGLLRPITHLGPDAGFLGQMLTRLTCHAGVASNLPKW